MRRVGESILLKHAVECLEFCQECGVDVVPGAKFCHSCGARIGSKTGFQTPESDLAEQALIELPLPPQTAVPGAMAEVIDSPDEAVSFSTSAPVTVEDKKWNVYVTNRKVVLHRSVGLVFPKESHQELDLGNIHRIALREEGTLLKEFFLDVDAISMKGRKSDLVNMYRAIQSARGQAKGR
jgi:zinc-ribbon domain